MSGATFKVGDLLNNTYRIEAALGRGGTSEVYQARSEISGNRVALKVLRAEFSRDEGFLNLMTREEDIREIRHDAIVRYYHNQRNDNGDVFLVMDFVDGPGLDKKLKSGGMPASDLMIVAQRVAEGLKAAHAKLIVHRDLSPDNIILRNGSPSEAVIIDFGIAKDTNPGAETVVGNEFAGKYAYAAPEQLSGRSDARSDIYSLGALLLATFRGKAPDIGRNPLEVIEKKGLPLDTSGVPEPLRGLIDRMTAPDPDARPQDIDAVLALIRGEKDAVEDEATVIAPVPPTRARAARPPSQSPPPPAVGDGRRGGLIAGIAALALAVGVAAAWLGGLLDPFLAPSLPLADPFTLVIERPPDGTVRAVGHVPSEAAADALAQQVAALGGTSELTLARGEIAPDWSAGVSDILDRVDALQDWRISVENNDLRVEALTLDRAAYDQLGPEIEQRAAAAGLDLQAAIELGPRLLAASTLAPILDAYADCGVLRLANPPALGYTNADAVRIVGRIASPEARDALADAVQRLAGLRELRLDTEVLNETLCLFDAVLPDAPTRGIEIVLREGASGAERADGRFVVGENPVIDIVLPAEMADGYLHVSALDVSGNVFHLLPNVNRPQNAVSTLRDGREGPLTLRLAHTLQEAAATEGRKLAFVVDESVLGKTRVIVIHSLEPLADGMRPTTESAVGYAEALAAHRAQVDGLDTRILTTARP